MSIDKNDTAIESKSESVKVVHFRYQIGSFIQLRISKVANKINTLNPDI